MLDPIPPFWLNTHAVGILLCSHGKTDYLNGYLAELLGYLPLELIGRSISDLCYDPAEYEIVCSRTYEIIHRGEEFIYSLRGRKKLGDPILLQIAGQLQDPDQIERGTFWIVTPLKEPTKGPSPMQEAPPLRQSLGETERFNKLATEREFRVIELKAEVNSWAEKQGEPPVYNAFVHPRLCAQESIPTDTEEPRSTLSLSDLVDLSAMQQLLGYYCETVGVASAIIDTSGKVLAESGWQNACTKFHRVHPTSEARCIESDTKLASRLNEGQAFAHYQCKNGLIDAASPIRVQGQHLANVFVGQFFDRPPDLSFFEKQAESFGYDKEEYRKAIREVPVIDSKQIPNILGFLAGFASLVANLAFDRLRASESMDRANQKSLELSKERSVLLSLAEDAELARSQTSKYQDRLELLVEARTEELRQANYSKNRVLSILSHDLRGPVGNFFIVFDLIAQGEMDLDTVLARSIAASALNLNNLLEDLLTWSQHQTGNLQANPRVFSVNEVASPTLDLLKTSAHSKSIVLTANKNSDLYCYGDPTLISTVLRNLISNAIKFTPQGGQIELSCTAVADRIRFKVTDSGAGLDPEDLRQVLLGSGTAMSTRGTAYEQGSGVGLTLCRDFLKASHSKIEAHSQMGKGTQFWFDLPQRSREEATLPTPFNISTSFGQFLLVEKDPINLKTSSLVLKSMMIPYQVVRAEPAAIEATLNESFGVLLIDLDTNEFRTLEAVEEIAEQCQPAPLMVGLTKYGRIALDERYGSNRFTGILERPLNPQHLTKLLQPFADFQDPDSA